MADTNDLARAREALAAPADVLDTSLLGAVHDGLLSVPADPTPLPGTDGAVPQLAVRRRTSA